MTDAAPVTPAADEPKPELASVPNTGDDRRIDLDEARRARREKQGPPPEIVFFGQAFPLPRALPAKVIDLIGDVGAGDYTASIAAMKVLIGGPVYDDVVARADAEGDPLEIDDVIFLLSRALEVYEVTLPESGASGTSS